GGGRDGVLQKRFFTGKFHAEKHPFSSRVFSLSLTDSVLFAQRRRGFSFSRVSRGRGNEEALKNSGI
ncbi:MAG: hypothetical protein RRY64_09320, partial [Oscillospiraceae bacterium]